MGLDTTYSRLYVLARLKIRVRIYLILALAMLAVFVATVLGLWSLRSQMLEDRRSQLGNLLELTLSIARTEMNSAGGPASEAGRKAFFRVIQTARFTDGGEKNYVFSYSHGGIGLAHIDPNKIGQNRLHTAYADGVPYVSRFVAIAQSPSGNGYIGYPMEKGGNGPITPKLSLIQNVPELGALVGTGVYIDDIDAAFWGRLLSFGAFLTAILTVIGILSYFIGQSISRPIASLTKNIFSLAKGDLDNRPAGTGKATELGEIARAVEVFRQRAIEQRALEQKLIEQTGISFQEARKAEAAAKAKSEFLSNMSHELRTPMHAILSYAKLGFTSSHNTDFAMLEKYFKHIHASGTRLLGLLNNLLDLAKLESGKMKLSLSPGDFVDVIEHSQIELAPLLKDKSLTLTTEVTAKSTVSAFDKQRMIQVLINLLSNSIKFSPLGSGISVRVSDSPLPDGGQGLRCSIADEGPGIPEDELDAVFDKFIQSSKTKSGAGGTGLGLSICREILKAHGGKIWAENRNPTGALVSFVLPCAAAQKVS